MTFTPQTNITLVKAPLTINYEDTIDFINLTNQKNYFNSLPKLLYSDYTYIKADNKITVEGNIENLYQYNYLFYINNKKTYYCFITKMEYIAEEVTDIYIETDVIQTYMFDINYRDTFIEREHVSDDTIGNNTIAENLELGDYTDCGKEEYNDLKDFCTVMQCSVDPMTGDEYGGDRTGNIFGGTALWIFGGTGHEGTALETTSLQIAIKKLASLGKTSAITCIFMLPKKLVGYNDNVNWQVNGGCTYRRVYKGINGLVEFNDFSISNVNNFHGYIPKNNKLKTFPYNYFILSNNNGGNIAYHYEDWDNNKPIFSIKGVPTPSGSIRAIPKNYKSTDNNFNEGLTGAKYPIGSFLNDIYINWLTQNGVNIALSLGQSAMQVGGGLLSGALGGGMIGASNISSGILGIASTLGTVYEHSLIPPQATGNLNNGDISFSDNNTTFTIYKIQIRREYAKIIDDYFSMYGYKINQVKTPNLKSRANFNYIKTINCNFGGNFNQYDLKKIQDIFNNGIRFWHNAINFLNFNVNNDII